MARKVRSNTVSPQKLLSVHGNQELRQSTVFTPSGVYPMVQPPTYLKGAGPAQIVAELTGKFPAEFAGKFWVQIQAGKEASQAQALQVTVGEAPHICIGLNHLLLGRDVAANQIPLT